MRGFTAEETQQGNLAGVPDRAPLRGFTTEPDPIKFDLSKKTDTSLGALLTVAGQEDILKTLQENPNIYGVIGAAYESGMAIGNFALDVIPGAKYLRPDDRSEYLKMDLQHQVRAGLFEVLGGTIFTPQAGIGLSYLGKGIWAGAKGVGKGFQAISQRVHPRLKIKPIEDLAHWTTGNYEKSVGKYLSKRKFSKVEAEAIYKWFDGDSDALRKGLIQTRLTGTGPSEAFEKVLVKRSGGTGLKELSEKTGRDFWLDNEFIRKMDPAKLRLAELKKGFTKTLQKEELLGKQYGRDYVENAFKAEAERYYGREVARKMSIKEASESELVNFAESMLQDSRAVLKSVQTPSMAGLNPTRWVFGRLTEMGYNTYDKVYLATTRIFADAKEYTIARINTYRAIMEQRGLGKLVQKGNRQIFEKSAGLTRSSMRKANEVLKQTDAILGTAKKINTKEGYEAAKKAIGELINPKDPDASVVRALVDSTHDYFDLLYGEDAICSLSKAFANIRMTPTGRIGVEKLLAKNSPTIQDLFTTGGSHGYVSKHQGIEAVLKEFVEAIPQTLGGRNRWFQSTGLKLEKEIKQLTAKLTLSSKKGGQFVEYLEGYSARIADIARGVEENVFKSLATKYSASYIKQRQLASAGKPLVELEELVVARTHAQAKRIFVYDELGEIAKFAGGLPESIKGYTEHFLARALNLPSKADEIVAKGIAATIGRFQVEPWTASRVMNLAKSVNDLSYMGFLGLKPFSAMRNFFQPFLLVPADLGGLKDYSHLVRGMDSLIRNPEVRAQIKSMGIITDFAPELINTTKIFGITGKEWLGVPLPDIERVRDICLYMFQNSDKFNRYITASAALSKWNTALGQVGGKVTKENLKQFVSRSGIKGRHSWIRDDIENLLTKGHLNDARTAFVKDVVADTQFLYGKLESPLIAQSLGAVGRTISIFQSWWMNYGHLMYKWSIAGQSPTHVLGAHGAKAEQALTWMLSATAGFFAMQAMWGTGTAARSTFLGPFPDPSLGLQLPPAWQPVASAMGMVQAAARTVQEGSLKPLGRQGLALIDSVTNFIPGALQFKATGKATLKEGFPGFAKSILKLGGKGSMFE